jgi:hypothetical protein
MLQRMDTISLIWTSKRRLVLSKITVELLIILFSTLEAQLGLINDPICERCQEKDESATHILCDCEAVAQIRFRHLGQFFMEPSD